MPDSSKTDPQNQTKDNKPTLKDAVQEGKSKQKVNLQENANPSKPSEVHGHNVNRTGPGGSK